jgi:hypothetical protein
LTEDEEHVLTFSAFPQVMHRSIRSTNAIESLLSHVRQRTDQIDAFTTETSCLTIVWAVIQDIRLPKIPVGERRNRKCDWLIINQPEMLGQGRWFLPDDPVSQDCQKWAFPDQCWHLGSIFLFGEIWWTRYLSTVFCPVYVLRYLSTQRGMRSHFPRRGRKSF